MSSFLYTGYGHLNIIPYLSLAMEEFLDMLFGDISKSLSDR